MRKIVFLIGLIGLTNVQAQTIIQDFSLTNVANGQTVSMGSFQSCVGYAVIFTSNECPYDQYYRGRIQSLIQLYQGKIQFILINPHVEPEESSDRMKAAYNTWNVGVPYLADKEQKAMDCFSARKSPECFLLKRVKDQYQLLFSGAIDDNAQAAQDVNQSYLKNALDEFLKNQVITQQSNRAVGCSIRRK